MHSPKKGFTIIEVVLVLAIAGLIFTMIFVGIPALQRSQRDAARKNDISLVYDALIRYQSNNKGKLPMTVGTGTWTCLPTGSSYSCTGNSRFMSFFETYIQPSKGGANYIEKFTDPSGNVYGFAFNTCAGDFISVTNPTDNLKNGEPCTGHLTFGHNAENRPKLDDGYWPSSVSFNDQNGVINVFLGARCDGERIVAKQGRYNFVVTYRLENNSVICHSNT